ncbi:MAG: cell wall hydrolase [Proteobacteria bacterium]|nr:cell wall hydrolase [Pseudomonadota bacterium]
MNSDANCQAVNAYFENRSLSDSSLTLTMWTVRNRVGRYHNQSVCDAVLNALYDDKGNVIKDTAHYSWVADGKQHKIISSNQKDMARFNAALSIAKNVSKLPSSADPTKGATHYYAVWSQDASGKKIKTPTPWWVNSKDMQFLFEFEGNRYYRGW